MTIEEDKVEGEFNAMELERGIEGGGEDKSNDHLNTPCRAVVTKMHD